MSPTSCALQTPASTKASRITDDLHVGPWPCSGALQYSQQPCWMYVLTLLSPKLVEALMTAQPSAEAGKGTVTLLSVGCSSSAYPCRWTDAELLQHFVKVVTIVALLGSLPAILLVPCLTSWLWWGLIKRLCGLLWYWSRCPGRNGVPICLLERWLLCLWCGQQSETYCLQPVLHKVHGLTGEGSSPASSSSSRASNGLMAAASDSVSELLSSAGRCTSTSLRSRWSCRAAMLSTSAAHAHCIQAISMLSVGSL